MTVRSGLTRRTAPASPTVSVTHSLIVSVTDICSVRAVWSLGRSSDECDQADLLAGHAAAEEDSDSSPGTPQQQQQADSSDQTEGSEGFWNTDVRATNMPLNLTEGPSHPVSMGGLRAASDSRLLLQSTDDLIGRMSSLESLRSHGEQRPPLQRCALCGPAHRQCSS